jgi:hypothetical protein
VPVTSSATNCRWTGWSRSLGLDVTYWTDIDLDRHPERLLAHRALVSLGHDEYWSTRMRRGAETAGPAGLTSPS